MAFCGFQCVFAGGTILLVDVSLASVQASFKKGDFFNPVLAVSGFSAHG